MARQLRLQRRGSGHGDEESGDEDSAEATPTEASSQHVGAQRGAIPLGRRGGGGRFENTGFFGLNVHPFHRISTYVCMCLWANKPQAALGFNTCFTNPGECHGQFWRQHDDGAAARRPRRRDGGRGAARQEQVEAGPPHLHGKPWLGAGIRTVWGPRVQYSLVR